MAFNTYGGQTFYLESSITSTATTIDLTSFLEPVTGTPITMALMNTDIAYGTIGPKTVSTEFISFTGITQNGDGTATLTGVTRGLKRGSDYTSSASFKLAHSANSAFILSNPPQVYNEYAALKNTNVFTGVNQKANNWVDSYATTATAAGTTTLTSSSEKVQYFTGSTTQTVVLPVTSTLTTGYTFTIHNESTGAVTVQSSGANTVLILAAGTSANFICILTSGTSAASWDYEYLGGIVASGKSLTVSNSLTLAGTDGTTMTFPSTSSTIPKTASAGTITSNSSTGGVGYATGAGGAVTQLTSKSTGVTLNTICGTITMNNATMASSTIVTFVLTNSTIAATDTVVVSIKSGATLASYSVTIDAVAAGSCTIQVRNFTAGSLSDAIVLNFAVIKSVNS